MKDIPTMFGPLDIPYRVFKTQGHLITIMSVVTIGLLTPSLSYSQEDSVELEEVVVTGSRIPQNVNISSASPVVSVGADEFLYTGITRVEDLLNDLPQVTGSNSSSDANGATGTATVDLRDLGPARTLTLMNGRRLPTGSPVQGAAGADLNFIPSALVQRVEVVTGGGSATYGTDAVAGVVNFIMKDDLDGFLFDIQGSVYQHSNDSSSAQSLLNESGFDVPDSSVIDGESYTLSLAYGNQFDNGKGNFTGYVTYRDTQDIQQSERDYSACAYGGKVADGSIGCVGSGTIPDGRFIPLLSDTADLKVSGDQFVPTDGTTFNFAPTNYFQRPDERITAGFFTDYDVNESMNVYAEVGYMNSQTLAQIAPSGSFFNSIDISCNNPLLSAQQVQALCGDFGLSGNDTSPTLVAKRNVEGGARAEDIELEQTRIVLGMRGDLNDNWNYDVSANFGKVDLTSNYLNDLSITNIGRSLDVVADANGEAVCRSALDGTDPNCVPWNLFQEGQVTQEALDYINLPLTSSGNTKMTNVIGFVTGDMTDAGWIVPGASNGIQLVAGLEYRKEELNFNPDANYQSGDGAGQGGPTPSVNGSFSASELFAEAKIPVTDSISLGLGYRYSDYDTDQQTDALKTTFDWQISNSFKARASYQAATRHANVRELFRPQGIGLFNGSDPCDGTPTATAAQCAQSGVTAAQYGSILENPAGQYNELQGGNFDLEPEESDTYSVGFVFTPEALPGFDMTVDWFSIDVQGAIGTSGSQFIIDSCVFSGEFCDRINRGPNGTLWLGTSNVADTNANIGFEEREGIDLLLNYSFEPGNLGSMRLSYNTAYALTYDSQPVPDSDIVDCNGKFNGSCNQPNPQYRHNVRLAWDMTDNVTSTLAWRHSGKVEEDTTDEVVERFSSQDYFDLAALWQMNDSTSIRFGINNIFDTEPPVSGVGGEFTNGNVEVTEYDVLGRYLFLGASIQL